ncbi:MAG: hypothetical protein PW843_09240 [Azospirillaceae bacterium]|nr:hypothetical protein [Azospirillaceae bacterium]
MTVDKDFKRIVRAKARVSGQPYSAVLRRLQPHGPRPSLEKTVMNIVRTLPDIGSTNLLASRAFCEGLLGFEFAMERNGSLIFASATQPKQQLTIDGGAAEAMPSPPGSSMDDGDPGSVTALYEKAQAQGCTIVEPPSGTRVTIIAHPADEHQPPR